MNSINVHFLVILCSCNGSVHSKLNICASFDYKLILRMIRVLRRAAYVPHIRSIGKKEPRRTDYQSGQYFIHNEYDYKGIVLYQGKVHFE